jgi:hypothetical protein
VSVVLATAVERAAADPSWVDTAQVVAAVFAVLAAIAIPATAYLRRPSVRLTEKGAARHSRVEGNDVALLRLVVENPRRRRAARGTRVIVEGYRRSDQRDDELVSLANPSLGWPSAIEGTAGAVTVFSGTGRPIGLGRFARARRYPDGRLVKAHDGSIAGYAANDPEGASWHLVLDLHNLSLTDDRDKLPPGEWVIRLLVGADDGDARAYDVHVAWSGDAAEPPDVLREALKRLHVERYRL